MKKRNLLRIFTVSILGISTMGSLVGAIISKTNSVEVLATGYDYSSVDTSSASALLSDLQDLFSSSSVSYSGGYGTLLTTYQTTDKRSDGYVNDIYSNTTSYSFSNNCGNYSGEGSCYNREHTIPKSWWGGGTSNQGSDPIIVLPSDGYVNGRRSNYIYGEVGDATYTSNNDYCKLGSQSSESKTKHGSVGTTVFEPNDEYKGDLARIVFYSRVRWTSSYSWTSGDGSLQYSGSASKNYGLTDYAIKLFTEWSELDPVSEWEAQRNEAVYSITGYRNPFVDHPEWVNTIWGGTTYTGSGTTISGLYLSDDSLTLATDESVTLSASTSGTDIGTISWSTSNSSVAALSATTGSSVTVTAGSTSGSATISASCTIDGETYTATCAVTVEESSEYTYSVVTSVDEISTGDEVLIVAQSGSSYFALTDENVGSYQYYIQASEVSVSNNQIADLDATSWTITKSGSNLSFVSENSKTLYNYINGSHYNITTTDNSSYSSSWTFTINNSATGAGYLLGSNGVYLTYQLYSNTTNEFLGSSSNPYSSYPIYLFKLGDTSGGDDTPTDSVSIDLDSLTLSVGESSTLSYTSSGTVTWSTSDEDIATISDGVVTGVSEGTATITATCGTASDICIVNVVDDTTTGGGDTSEDTSEDTGGDDTSEPDTNVTELVQSWVDTYLYMETYTENLGYCADSEHAYYSNAKIALISLGEDCINELRDNDIFNDAQKRYEAWASANGDKNPYTATASSITLDKVDNSYTAYIIIFFASLSGLAIITIVSLKKHKKQIRQFCNNIAFFVQYLK